MASKFVTLFALACVLCLNIVDSCNSNTGTASTGGACGCQANSPGAACSSGCQCDASAGLICNSGACECKNKTSSIWDQWQWQCVGLTTDFCNKNIGPIFVDDAQASDWRCNLANERFYGPSYNGTSSKGIYQRIKFTNHDAVGSRKICESQNMKIILYQPDQESYDFIKAVKADTWVGITLNSKVNKYFYDNDVEFTGTFANPSDNFGCVKTDSAGEYTKVACDTELVAVCAYY
jgi:hypothetical protein